MAQWVFSSSVHLPNPDLVLKKMGRSSMAIYRELLTDDRVGSGVESLKAGIKSQDWQIEQGESDTAVFDHVKQNFKLLRKKRAKKTNGIHRIIGSVLNASLFGMQPMERVWQHDGSKTWLKDLVGKPPEWFHYDIDGNLRFRQKDIPEGVIVDDEAHRYQFQVAKHEDDYLNPYGFAILSRCFWPVIFKKGGIKFWATFLEKWGMPHAIAKLPVGTDKGKVDEYLKQLEALVQDGVAVLWDNSKVELLNAQGGGGKSSGDLYSQLIDWANDAITTSILGHQGASQSTPGKLGGEDMAAITREEIVWANKNLVKEEMDTLIADMVEINFGPGVECPEFVFFEKEDIDKRAERDGSMTEKMGVVWKKPYIARTYNVSEEDFELREPVQPPDPTQAGNPPGPLFAAPHDSTHASHVIKNQQALQKMLEDLKPEEMQEFADAMLAPVLELARKAESFDEILTGLADLFPQMDTEKMQLVGQKMLFIAESVGRMA